VATSPRNCYTEIDRVEKECIEELDGCHGYKVLITAMGATGIAIIKRLWGRYDDVFFLDFGSLLDAVCDFKKDGEETRAWMDIVKFDKEIILGLLRRRFKGVE